jgi:hypothetical protein
MSFDHILIETFCIKENNSLKTFIGNLFMYNDSIFNNHAIQYNDSIKFYSSKLSNWNEIIFSS